MVFQKGVPGVTKATVKKNLKVKDQIFQVTCMNQSLFRQILMKEG